MKTIGIIVAMTKELDPFVKAINSFEKITKAKYEFLTADYCGKRIVMVACGVGKANAAIAAQILITNFGADVLINAGVAGGVGDGLKVFDIVIAEKCVNHDIATRFMEKYTPNTAYFETDKSLREKALEICKAMEMTAFTGLIASGDIYVSETAMRNKIIAEFSPLAVDMETVSVAMCCYRNDVPFLSIRSISDSADEESTVFPDEFERIAAIHASKIVLDLLKD